MRRIAIAGVVCACTALPLGGLARAAGIVTPPAGTPNLALMVIQPADLVAGATLVTQGYVKAPKSFAADYSSEFGLVQTDDGTKLDALEDDVALADSSTDANLYFAGQEALFGTRSGQKRLVKILIKTSPKRDRLTRKEIRFGASTSAGVGPSSFVETVYFTIRHVRFQQVVLLFDAGTIDASVVLTGTPNAAVPQSSAIDLGETVSAHIASTLGATGATGTT